jgi:hypothetical protein
MANMIGRERERTDKTIDCAFDCNLIVALDSRLALLPSSQNSSTRFLSRKALDYPNRMRKYHTLLLPLLSLSLSPSSSSARSFAFKSIARQTVSPVATALLAPPPSMPSKSLMKARERPMSSRCYRTSSQHLIRPSQSVRLTQVHSRPVFFSNNPSSRSLLSS